jgi:hypothetical protein
VPDSALVSEHLGQERSERGLVHDWVDVAHDSEDKAVEWVGCGGRSLGLGLGARMVVGSLRSWLRSNAFQSLRVPLRL